MSKTGMVFYALLGLIVGAGVAHVVIFILLKHANATP